MKKIKIYIISLMVMIFGIFALGCSSSPGKLVENAIKKNSEIEYCKQESDIKIGVLGLDVNIKASGEIDSKNKTAIMKLNINSPIAEINNLSTDVYLDKNNIFIKDIGTDNFIKLTVPEEEIEKNSNMVIASKIMETLKQDKEFSKSLKLEDKDSSKVFSAKISDETMNKLINKLFESEEFINTLKNSAETQFANMAEISDENKNKDEIKNTAKQEAEKEIEKYKEQIKNIKVQDVTYSGKINKEGYLSEENVSFSIKEESLGITLTIKVNSIINDINKEKTIKIPEIHKEKITNL